MKTGKYWILALAVICAGLLTVESKPACQKEDNVVWKIWVKCRNPRCQAEYQMTEKEYFEYVKKHHDPKTMKPRPLVCKKCGQESVCRAIKCERCGSVFFYPSKEPGCYGDKCSCGYSRIEKYLDKFEPPERGQGVAFRDAHVRFFPDTLAGLPGVKVAVNYLGYDAHGFRLKDATLQTDVEWLLRQNGVKVPGPGRLEISIEIKMLERTDLGAASIIAELKEAASLKRDPTICTSADTWQRTALTTGRKDDIKKDIREQVECLVYDFLDSYHAVNPKEREPKIQDAQMITGTVRYLDFEGGFYGLVADNGEKYDPVNLPKEYKQDGLRVKFQVKEKKGMVGFHMWGKIVEVVEIERLQGRNKRQIIKNRS